MTTMEKNDEKYEKMTKENEKNEEKNDENDETVGKKPNEDDTKMLCKKKCVA